MKKFLSTVLAVTMATSMLAGCGSSSSSEASAPAADSSSSSSASTETAAAPSADAIVVKFGTVVSNTHPAYAAMEEFEASVEAKSGGALDVQLYPSSQLGGEREMIEAMAMGTTEMYWGGTSTVGNFTNKSKFWQLPFFFSGGVHACLEFFEVYGDEIGEGILAETGVHCVWTDNGSFNPANSVRPINTPDDMVGLKFRCQEVDMYSQAYEALGATAVPIAYAEIYTALQQGAVDGTNVNNILLENDKFCEVCEYYSVMNLLYDIGLCGISEIFMDTLPEDLQAILWEEAEVFRQNLNEFTYDAGQAAEQRMTESGQVEIKRYTAEEMAVFEAKVQPSYDAFIAAGIEPNFDKYYAAAQEINAKYLD